MCFYSNYCVLEYASSDYKYEIIEGQKPLAESAVSAADLNWTKKEYENKLGVFITRLQSRPHSSLMAFLSNECDDIFLITFKSTFKSKAIHRNNQCCFAIDHRSDFVFERAYDWNYTIINAEAYTISKHNPVFSEIQDRFVEKNPWESSRNNFV